MHDKKCFDANAHVDLALLQMKSTPMGPWLQSPTILLFNSPIRRLMPRVSRMPINFYYNEISFEATKVRQSEAVKNNDIFKECIIILIEYMGAVL